MTKKTLIIGVIGLSLSMVLGVFGWTAVSELRKDRQQENLCVYVVKNGDWLGKIARFQLGNENRVEEIIALNNLKKDEVLHVGDELLLPNE